MEKIKKHFGRWVLWIGLVSAVVTIFAFVTGKASLGAIFSESEGAEAKPPGASASALDETSDSPSPSAPQSLSDPPQTNSETPTTEDPTSPVPTRTSVEKNEAIQEPSPTESEHAGPLIINIEMGEKGKVGVDTWSKGSRPGANTDVFDSSGQLRNGCYVQWTLYRQEESIQTKRSGACRSGGITMFNFGDSLDEVGKYRLTADVTTDWGVDGSESYDFSVVDG
ncbi:hypothetical protein E4N62_36070 [Streptomyces sp. MNU76]|uniref:hypothetical protein n=1 Tax=Streptomyces sp. MNU76 TaxID=2560026 RepID=UPI001E2D3DE9|nr:hypothetical protein [Streptomyces sp. MNU76]MCC9710207.1 hypothetical protein [Streptomyces sp. MNU76]